MPELKDFHHEYLRNLDELEKHCRERDCSHARFLLWAMRGDPGVLAKAENRLLVARFDGLYCWVCGELKHRGQEIVWFPPPFRISFHRSCWANWKERQKQKTG